MTDRVLGSLPVIDFQASRQPTVSPTVNGEPHAKLERLSAVLTPALRDGLLIAFSGGVDSAFLLWAAEMARRQAGGRLVALTAVSDAVPALDRDDAIQFSTQLEVRHIVRQSAETELPDYVRNDRDRCFHCKSELFRMAQAAADELGMRWLAYGYTASDRGDIRPGHRAAADWDVMSPLADAELTKDDIRTLMRAHGLLLSEKPASPCLSSRIMTGISITRRRLKDVHEIEDILREAGVRVYRVRICGHEDQLFLRIEVAQEEMPKVLGLRDTLVTEAQARGYQWATLDLGGYRTGGGTA